MPKSIRFDQASFGVQLRLAFRRAFARTMSVRMTAVRPTFAGFPAFIELLALGLHIRIEPGCDEGWHVDGLADRGSAAPDKGMSGRVSSEGWHVQQEKGLPGQELEAP